MSEPALRAPSRCGLHVALLLFVAFVVHGQTLLHPFFLDDYVYLSKAQAFDWNKLIEIVTSPALDQSASGVWWAPAGALPFYRPLGQLTFVADYFIWGLNPFGFHLTNVLLHLLCTFLTWRLGLRLFEAPRYALAAATAFALHPIHSEAVTWISGRFDSLVCICVLLSILSYLRWVDRPEGGWRFAASSVFWFIVGLGCKETAMILPAMIGVMEILRRRLDRDDVRRLAPVVIVFAVAGVLYMTVRVALLGGPLGKLPPPYGLDTSSPAAALAELTWNSAQYILDIVLCIPIEPAFLPLFWREHYLLFAAAVLISLMLLLGAGVVGRSIVSRIGVAWLILFTAPVLLSMPGERNIYLASVGLALFIGAAYRGLTVHDATLPGTRVARSAWWRRASLAVLAIWLVVGASQETLMGRVTMAGEKLYRQIESMVPEPAQGARIYVVHQSPLNSVGFAQAIQLRYGRSDVTGCALTLSPTIAASQDDRVEATGPNSIRIARSEGRFFGSFVERFHLFAQPAAMLADLGGRFGVELLDPPTSYDGLTELEFRLPYSLDDPRLVILYWDNHRIRKTRDLRRIGDLSELVRWQPREGSDN